MVFVLRRLDKTNGGRSQTCFVYKDYSDYSLNNPVVFYLAHNKHDISYSSLSVLF